MSVREQFVDLAFSGRYTIAECCIIFHVSEKTGYKWLKRFRSEGRSGLADRSHIAHTSPHAISPVAREKIIELRDRHPTWGARKLKASLQRRFPHLSWPAASSIGDLLRREGMIRSRRRRNRAQLGLPLDLGLTVAQAPNDVWTTDFKGEFRLENGSYCYPLTIADAQSRYLLGCTALSSTSALPVKLVFERIFKCYGLPHVIRSDNGVPFASANALGRLSSLSVWWIQLGIRPERIEPGHPQQNGQHERMHRTLKDEATKPPSSSLTLQQQRFDRWRRSYNDERPHESLAQQPPASLYTRSHREFPKQLPVIDYPNHFEVRRVGPHGMVMMKGNSFWLTKALAGRDVGLEEIDNDTWSLYFGELCLGSYDLPTNSFLPELEWGTTARFPSNNDR